LFCQGEQKLTGLPHTILSGEPSLQVDSTCPLRADSIIWQMPLGEFSVLVNTHLAWYVDCLCIRNVNCLCIRNFNCLCIGTWFSILTAAVQPCRCPDPIL
jgi:hypothetical protein